jgi:glucose/arabinose dehydrogenase
LQIRALATDLQHPRSVYALPNGDVLVVEANGPKAPVYRPKDLVMGWVQSFAGSKAKGGNRITLLRGGDDDRKPTVRTVFLDHLNSPFGVALVGQDLYVANTDAIVRYPYKEGQTTIADEGTKVTDLPGGPIDHHWTKSLLASPDDSKLYVGVGSNSNITENGMPAEYERASIWEVDIKSGAHRIFASGLRNPTGLQWEPQTGKLWAIANERDELGPDLVPDYLTSVQDGAFYGWPYSYYGQHVDLRVEPQRRWSPWRRYQITLAVAGFSPDEISITAEQNVVTIEGGKTEKTEREFLYRGISTRHFRRQFNLADYVQVKGAGFDNGLLKIELVREIPEAMKPRRIAINGASSADNVHQIEAKAA